MWTKNKKERVKVFFQALGVVLVMHLLLLVLFKAPSAGQVQETPRSNRISLLPNNSARFDRNAFNNWLVYADPTLIAQPNEQYGYGLLVAPAGLRNDFMAVDVARVDDRFDFERIISKPSFFSRDGKLVRNYDLPDFNYALPDQKQLITFPLIVNDEGKMIQGLFGGVEMESAIKNANITGPSIIKISKVMNEMAMPRFLLLKSCGVPEFDRLAIRTIVGSLNFVNGKSGDILLNVYWKPEDEGGK